MKDISFLIKQCFLALSWREYCLQFCVLASGEVEATGWSVWWIRYVEQSPISLPTCETGECVCVGKREELREGPRKVLVE